MARPSSADPRKHCRDRKVTSPSARHRTSRSVPAGEGKVDANRKGQRPRGVIAPHDRLRAIPVRSGLSIRRAAWFPARARAAGLQGSVKATDRDRVVLAAPGPGQGQNRGPRRAAVGSAAARSFVLGLVLRALSLVRS